MARRANQNKPVAREQFRVGFQVIDLSLESGTFRGVASMFGSMVDAWTPTIVDRGAFTKTLQQDAKRVKILYQHDTYEPIGVPTEMRETDLGLEVVGKISMTDRGKDCLTLMRDGVIDELSIGFDPVVYESIKQADGSEIRHLKEVRLWEFSPVTFAADPNARIGAVHERQADAPPTEESAGWQLALGARGMIEMHEGKVLSAKNIALVTDARDALQKLLDAATPPANDTTQSRHARMSQLRNAQLAQARSAIH